LNAGGLVKSADAHNMNALQRENNVLLLKHGSSVNKEIGRKFITNWHALPCLTGIAASHEKSDATGLTGLHAAALYGRPEELSVFIQTGASFRTKDQSGRTALRAVLELSLLGKHLSRAWVVHH